MFCEVSSHVNYIHGITVIKVIGKSCWYSSQHNANEEVDIVLPHPSFFYCDHAIMNSI